MAVGFTMPAVILLLLAGGRYQGLDLLVAAARHVVHQEQSVRFLLVGGTPVQIERLQEQADATGVASSFVFVAAVPPERVFLYHRLADILVTTRSAGTNTPLKIYQYLRAGVPIVATAIGSHTQVLTAASAELVPPTPQGIASGLLRVLGDPDHARSLADAAGRLAREQYSTDTYMERLSTLLAQLPVSNAHSWAVA